MHQITQQLCILAKLNSFQTECITCFLWWWAAGNYLLASEGVFPLERLVISREIYEIVNKPLCLCASCHLCHFVCWVSWSRYLCLHVPSPYGMLLAFHSLCYSWLITLFWFVLYFWFVLVLLLFFAFASNVTVTHVIAHWRSIYKSSSYRIKESKETELIFQLLK